MSSITSDSASIVQSESSSVHVNTIKAVRRPKIILSHNLNERVLFSQDLVRLRKNAGARIALFEPAIWRRSRESEALWDQLYELVVN